MALVAAAREAMTNAAKFGGRSTVDVYAETADGRTQVQLLHVLNDPPGSGESFVNLLSGFGFGGHGLDGAASVS